MPARFQHVRLSALKIVLLAADGWQDKQIAGELGVSEDKATAEAWLEPALYSSGARPLTYS